MAVICGMPGVGKSAPASVLASRTAAPDRIFWHSFHAEEGFGAMIWRLGGFRAHRGEDGLRRMLQSMGQGGGQPPPTEMLFDYTFESLRGQDYLLCLDDLQFVEEELLFAAQIERLLGLMQAGELSLFVTSRRLPDFVASSTAAALESLIETDTRAVLAARGLALAGDLAAELHHQTAGNAQLLTLAVDALRHTRDLAWLIAHLPEADDIERYLLQEVDRGSSNQDVKFPFAPGCGLPAENE
jgi:hypothetical protein